MIDLSKELAAALSSPDTREELRALIREALRAELDGTVMDDRMLDVNEAAEVLATTPAALRKAALRGRVRCHRLGRRVLFRKSDLLRREPREQALRGTRGGER